MAREKKTVMFTRCSNVITYLSRAKGCSSKWRSGIMLAKKVVRLVCRSRLYISAEKVAATADLEPFAICKWGEGGQCSLLVATTAHKSTFL